MSIITMLAFVMLVGGLVVSMMMYLHYQGHAALVSFCIAMLGLFLFIPSISKDHAEAYEKVNERIQACEIKGGVIVTYHDRYHCVDKKAFID